MYRLIGPKDVDQKLLSPLYLIKLANLLDYGRKESKSELEFYKIYKDKTEENFGYETSFRGIGQIGEPIVEHNLLKEIENENRTEDNTAGNLTVEQIPEFLKSWVKSQELSSKLLNSNKY